MDDSDAVRRFLDGESAAWEYIVITHREAVFRLAYLLLGDPADAEDVAQETFMRAYAALRRFDSSRPLRPWLLRIASNLARNRRRAAGRYFKALQRLAFEQATLHSEPTIESEDARQRDAVALWQAIRKLALADQQVIYLRYFLHLSVDESADALDLAPGTVKSRLHRALQRLRAVIEMEFPALRVDGDSE